MDRELTTTKPVLRIAADYGLAESSLRRHRDNHLTPALADALARRTEVDAEKLIAWLAGIQERTLAGIVRTESAKDYGNMRALIREARENIALFGRLGGVLDGDAVHVDARRQTLVLGKLSDEDLRELAAASRDGRLPELAERVGVPEAAVLSPTSAEVAT